MDKKNIKENSMFSLSPYETFDTKPENLKKSKKIIKKIVKNKDPR